MTKRQPHATKKSKRRYTLDGQPAVPVLVYFPENVVPLIDSTASSEDLDRSKFIRRAVRNALGASAFPDAAC